MLTDVRRKKVVIACIFLSECFMWYFANIFASAHELFMYLFCFFWVLALFLVVATSNSSRVIDSVLSAMMIYSVFMFFVLMNSSLPYYKMDPSRPVFNIFYFKRDAGIVFGAKGLFAAFVNCGYLVVISKFFKHKKV